MGERVQASEEAHAGDLGPDAGVVPGGEACQSRATAPATAAIGAVLGTTLQHFFPEFPAWLGRVRDPRDPERVEYDASFLLATGILLFLTKLGSRRRIKFAFNASAMLSNINAIAKSDARRLAHPDTLEYLLRRLAVEELPALEVRMVRHLLRMRALDRFRLLGHVLVAVDGTGNLTFRFPHCEHCLTQKQGDETIYYHMALEAKLVTRNGMAFSLATEFIENPTPEPRKQDCERKAFARLAPQLKSAFPQMKICLLLDSLYLEQPAIRTCRENRWAFITTFKEGSAPAVWREFKALQKLCPKNRLTRTARGVRQEFRWVKGLAFGDETVDAIECMETDPDGNVTRYAWITNLHVDRANVVAIANEGGRLRWKIENEGFNEQKNGGYNLEHAYSENEHAAKNYYALLQIAHLVELLMQKGNLLSRRLGCSLRELVGGVRSLGQYLMESLRNHVIPAGAFDPVAARHIQIRFDTS